MTADNATLNRTLLQLGPGMNTGESWHPGGARICRGHASIGPRNEYRGESAWAASGEASSVGFNWAPE